MSNSKGNETPATLLTGGSHMDEINCLCRRARALAEIVSQAAPGLEDIGDYMADEHPVPWVMQILQDEINLIQEHAKALWDPSVG
jgi:hypothetical protein